MTKISSKNQILQRTGEQRFVDQSFVPQMVEQLEEVPKMVSQHVVLPEPLSERICGQSGVIEATKRTVEQDSRGLHV